MSPLTIVAREERRPLHALVTSLSAIVGGVWAVVSGLDSLLHASLRSLRYKRGIGKLS
jgi:hypothetical protein